MNEHNSQASRGSIAGKMILVGMIAFLCSIAAYLSYGIISERKERLGIVENSIAEEWGRSQTIVGPVLSVPYRTSMRNEKGELVSQEQILTILPESFSLTTTIEPSERKRGIFTVPVYRAKVTGKAVFTPKDTVSFAETGVLIWERAVVGVAIADARSIDPQSSLVVNGIPQELDSGVGGSAPFGVSQGIHAPIPAQKWPLTIEFTTSVNGSQAVSFVPVGEVSEISVSSPWKTPSYMGAYLPTHSTLDSQGFHASWSISALGRGYPSVFAGNASASVSPVGYTEDWQKSSVAGGIPSTGSMEFGVRLFSGVDQYTQSERAVKYAILFIGLTFLTFFLFEVMGGRRLHPMQYLFVGSALALFYVLLIAFSEQVGFGRAYLMGAFMTTFLIAGYCRSVLGGGKRATLVGVVLALSYCALYVILRLEDYALLTGALLLFAVLTLAMFVTRKIDWYAFDGGKRVN